MARKAAAGELIFPKSETGQVRMKEYFNEFRNANIPIKSSLGLYDAQYNTQYLTRLMGAKVFLNPKHIRLMRDLLAFTTQGDDIVLDFFGGSGTTADALLSLNAEDGQRRRFVLVQLDVPVEPASAAGKAGYATIADLCRDRIDRAGAALDPAKAHPDWDGDIGYRVFDVEGFARVFHRGFAVGVAPRAPWVVVGVIEAFGAARSPDEGKGRRPLEHQQIFVHPGDHLRRWDTLGRGFLVVDHALDEVLGPEHLLAQLPQVRQLVLINGDDDAAVFAQQVAGHHQPRQHEAQPVGVEAAMVVSVFAALPQVRRRSLGLARGVGA